MGDVAMKLRYVAKEVGRAGSWVEGREGDGWTVGWVDGRSQRAEVRRRRTEVGSQNQELENRSEELDGGTDRMGSPAGTDGKGKEGVTAQWKQDRENRKGELGPQISQITRIR